MRRSTKRSIYLQVLLFSANGIYTTFADKTMKLMMFATLNDMTDPARVHRADGVAASRRTRSTWW